MKKIFTLIATAFVALSVNAQTALIDYPTSKTGITLYTTDDSQVTYGTVKINLNTNTVDGIKFGKTFKYADSEYFYATLTTDGGFKAGDVISITGVYNHADEKAAAIKFYTDPTGAAIWQTENFINGRLVEASPEAQTFTLTADAETLYFGRQGGTATYILSLTVTRSGAETWDASTLDLTTAITARENSGANLKQVPEQYPGEAPAEDQIKADATAQLTLTDYIFTVKTASVTLTGVSTPNSDQGQDDAWRFGSTNENQFLNTDACPVKFAGSYLQAKTGNPSMSDIEYFFTNSSGTRVGPRTVETFWEPNCGQLPAKGEYLEVTFSKAGTFTAGLFIQRPTSNLYILDKETIQLLAPSAISFAGFNNNNTVEPVEGAGAYQEMKLNDDYTFSFANTDYEINTGKQIFGFASFTVEAGKTYLLFNPKNQLGIYGFQFKEAGDGDGIESITTKAVKNNANAPLYNLAGQQVDKSYKGIVIQNGRKFYNK